MAVEITGLPQNPPQTSGATTQNTTAVSGDNASAQQANSTRTVSSDAVTLTSQAQQLREAESNANSQSVVDSQRVESLKSAIDAGAYVINPISVAEKFIQFETSLAGA